MDGVKPASSDINPNNMIPANYMGLRPIMSDNLPIGRRSTPIVKVSARTSPSLPPTDIRILTREFITFSDCSTFCTPIVSAPISATIIGITVELSFLRSRGKEVRKAFQKQMVEEYDPTVYLFTRNLGTLRLSPLMPLSEWLNKGEVFEFDSIESE